MTRRRRLHSEHGPIRWSSRVGPEHPAAIDAMRILARLLVAAKRAESADSDLPSSAELRLHVGRGVAS
jgi:hypothetical protein